MAFGDVPGEQQDPADVLVLEHVATGDLDEPVLAFRAPEANLHGVGVARHVQRPAMHLQGLLVVRGVDELHQLAADELVPRPSDAVVGVAVAGDPPARVDDQVQVGNEPQDPPHVLGRAAARRRIVSGHLSLPLGWPHRDPGSRVECIEKGTAGQFADSWTAFATPLDGERIPATLAFWSGVAAPGGNDDGPAAGSHRPGRRDPSGSRTSRSASSPSSSSGRRCRSPGGP